MAFGDLSLAILGSSSWPGNQGSKIKLGGAIRVRRLGLAGDQGSNIMLWGDQGCMVSGWGCMAGGTRKSQKKSMSSFYSISF